MTQTPAHIAPYVDVLGSDLALKLLIELGGSEVYFGAQAGSGGKLAKVVGRDKARELAQRVGAHTHRVPLPRKWLIVQLRAKGLPVAEIARRLHVTDVTVRRHLSDRPRDDRQSSFGF
ncbi:MAG: helix-turn-helix domain-containing protein [Pseudomonadota bacterium]